MDKIRVLVLVTDAWRLDNSGGNTLDNFFHGVKGLPRTDLPLLPRMPWRCRTESGVPKQHGRGTPCR